ncbi:SpoIIE family protein phosphatase [Streptomyces pristinaespiralis]|uniref:Magnesium or manganese-dependent protein phosphatase n=2 Tax=Streptomyces pristinaespiralis TaxID=38300 RepID=B5H6R5_STRE2|nr:SpoIIE family protein phosphatase [Streptomyces pristinaespiralis]ALC18694.1 protein phosphatase [Streptomyces pristinaespiralis]EDY62526.2 magnesium or manganese-dependent protein phosphatase [Streptomyces pristinaespiralis ATCC 25486]QMU18140.1 SpoIIE family protein phosphatase [Streptomyces pristinaespiralis]
MTNQPSAMSTASPRLLDATNLALAVLDRRGVVVGWSSAAEALVGYGDQEILNRPAATLLHNDADPAIAAALQQGRTQGGWDGAVTVRHRNGRHTRLMVRVFSWLDAAGETLWAVLAHAEDQVTRSELSQGVFEPLLTYSPIGVAVLDTNLRYLWVNEVLTYGGAAPSKRRVGQRVGQVFPQLEGVAQVEEQLRNVLETGIPVLDFEFHAFNPQDSTRTHVFWMSFFRLEDSTGRVVGVWYMALDNTDRWRTREREALLSEASTYIGSTLDVERTAQELTEIVVPRFADAVAVDLFNSVLHGGDPPHEPDTGTLRAVGQRWIPEDDSEAGAHVAELLHQLQDSAATRRRCLHDGEAWMESLACGAGNAVLSAPPPTAEKLRELGVHSVLVAPVQARGTGLGVAAFARFRNPDSFDESDVGLTTELLSRAGVCIDNARRFTRERRAALTLQRSLLPRALATGDVLDVASRYLPAGDLQMVGGDWFDVIPLSGARVALVVGDVVGRGSYAAVSMGRLRAAVRTLANTDLPPDELLAHLDDLVISLAEQEQPDEETPGPEVSPSASFLGATCLYAVYDAVTRCCTVARAGHVPPAVVAPDGTVSFPDLPAGPPLGLGLSPFEATELQLPEGALLALYTDGLIKSHDQDIDVGLSRLAGALAHPAPRLEDLCENVFHTLLPGDPGDDAALLLARTHGLDPDQVSTWDLARDPSIVAETRGLVTRRLADWHLDDLQFTTELIVSELVTNAIRYGSEPIKLRLIRQSTLICEVLDNNSTSPRLRHARTTDEGGRGLFLVAQLARRWGTRYTRSGKIIWAEQSLPPQPETSHPA